MWKNTADTELKGAFDDAIEAAYGGGTEGELENLANLFSDEAISDYQAALRTELEADSTAFVDVAWIDKRPIAKPTDSEDGSELGDMLLVVHEYEPSGRTKSRACLLEVKQSKPGRTPKVPVHNDRSTLNQFNLLGSWPTIEWVKKTGSNSGYILTNIKTRPYSGDGDVLAQAWYVVVKPSSEPASPNGPWTAAPAVSDAVFEHSLGELFSACARGDSLYNSTVAGKVDVGRPFDAAIAPGGKAGWDALIVAIIKVARYYRRPPSLFPGARRPRYHSGRDHAHLAMSGLGLPLFNESTLAGLLFGVLLSAVVFLAITVGIFARDGWQGNPCVARRRLRRGAFPVLTLRVMHGRAFDLERG